MTSMIASLLGAAVVAVVVAIEAAAAVVAIEVAAAVAAEAVAAGAVGLTTTVLRENRQCQNQSFDGILSMSRFPEHMTLFFQLVWAGN